MSKVILPEETVNKVLALLSNLAFKDVAPIINEIHKFAEPFEATQKEDGLDNAS